MSPIAPKLAVLALASSALAVPFAGHGHGHAKQHRHFFHGSAVSGSGAPYGLANSTGIWGTGTGASSGFASATGLATGSGFVHPSPVGPETGSKVLVADTGSSEAAVAAETSSCTSSVVRVTHTNRVTVTVQASGSVGSSQVAPVAASSSSVVVSSPSIAAASNSSVAASTFSVAAVSSSSSSVAMASSSTIIPSSSLSSASASLDIDIQGKGYHGHRKSSTAASSSTAAVQTSTSKSSAAPVETSTSESSAAPVSTSTTPSSSVAPVSSVVSVASSLIQASSTASSSSASASATSGSTGSGKRGVAYNDASLTTAFEGSNEVTWGYNWGQTSSGLSSSFNFIPMLWGTASTFTDAWSETATDAISNGVTHLMSFNEPDMTSQSNLSPSEAAAAYKTYMEPFAGKAKLGAPAVTNGGGSMGLNWLSAFLEECSDCTIDFVSIHWYDSASNAGYFKDQVQNATDVAGGLPVYVTEFGCTSGTDDEISSFLEEVMPWMDEQDFVGAYSYFMVADGYLVSGSELSSYGSTYATYTSS